MRGDWCMDKSWRRKEDLETSPGRLISRNRIGRAVSASEKKSKWRCSSKTRREECQDAQLGRIWEKYHENFLLPKSNLLFYPYVLTTPSNLHCLFPFSHFVARSDKTNHVDNPCPHVDLRGRMAEWEELPLWQKELGLYSGCTGFLGDSSHVLGLWHICFFAFPASFPSSFCDNIPILL